VADTSYKEFDGRLRRIAKTHRRGGGFEASGTLGQSYYTRRTKTRRPILRPALTALVLFICFKALTLAHLGTADYTARLEALQTGGTVQKIGAHFMAIDPITDAAAAGIKPLLR